MAAKKTSSSSSNYWSTFFSERQSNNNKHPRGYTYYNYYIYLLTNSSATVNEPVGSFNYYNSFVFANVFVANFSLCVALYAWPSSQLVYTKQVKTFALYNLRILCLSTLHFSPSFSLLFFTKSNKYLVWTKLSYYTHSTWLVAQEYRQISLHTHRHNEQIVGYFPLLMFFIHYLTIKFQLFFAHILINHRLINAI